jgi:hypothetical protein
MNQGALASRIEAYGGYRVWASRLGYVPTIQWTAELIKSELAVIGASLGRMPSKNELSAMKKESLASSITRHGGYRAWALRMSLSLKNTETARGQIIEDAICLFLAEQKFVVERMTTRAPYDFFVNGHLRIDVKSAQYGEYGHDHYSKGFVFALNKKIPTCDLYILCGVNKGNEILWRYFIPASQARITILTITPHGKYTRYRNNIHVLTTMATSH